MIIRFGREDYIDTKALKELVDEQEEEQDPDASEE